MTVTHVVESPIAVTFYEAIYDRPAEYQGTIIREGETFDVYRFLGRSGSSNNTDFIYIDVRRPSPSPADPPDEPQLLAADGPPPDPDGIVANIEGTDDANSTIFNLAGLTITYADLAAGIALPLTRDRYAFWVSLLDGDVVVDGSPGNDQALEVGEDGAATVAAGAGNDTLSVWHHKDVVYDGGPGDDTLSFQAASGNAYPTPFAQPLIVDLAAGAAQSPYGGSLTLTDVENVIGTSQADSITGSDAANVIGDGIADSGADTIAALGGDDVVLLAPFNSAVTADGGAGSDELSFTIEDGTGAIANVVLDLLNPALNTGPLAGGDFTNFEAYTAATLIAVAGDIFVFGGSEEGERVRGQNGRLLSNQAVAFEDILSGRGGNDTMSGERGRDSLAGGAGDDSLDGGIDNDSLNGGGGDDTILGGLGTDRAIFAGPQASYSVAIGARGVIVSGPDGTDEVGGVEALQFDDGQVEAPAIVFIENGSLVEGSTRFMSFKIGLSRDLAQPVTVLATTSNGTALAGFDFTARTDVLVTIPAGVESTTFSVEIFNDALFEGDESFTVTLSNPGGGAQLGTQPSATGTILDDVVAATPALSIADISTVEGNNLVFTVSLSQAAAQDVTVQATTQDESAKAGSDYTTISSVVTIQAGQTSATFSVPVSGDSAVEIDESLRVTLSSPTGGAAISATAGSARGLISNDDLTPSLTITGQTINGTAGDDFLVGGTGSDSISGQDGADTEFGNAASDVLIGGNGNDFILGDFAGNFLDGSADFIDAGAGNDNVFGGGGDDTIFGGPGDDLIGGDTGNNLIFGGDGNNALFGFDGADTIEGGNDGDIVFGLAGPDVIATKGGFDLIIAGGDGDGPGDADFIDAGDGGSQIFAGSGNDTILAGNGSGDDFILGESGADSIASGAGNDALIAGPGNDTLHGGAGNDLLIAEGGDDSLAGGAGADVFRYPAGIAVNADRIADFAPADDTIELDDSLGFATGAQARAAVQQVGADAVLTVTGGSITFVGLQASALTAADFVIL